MKQVNGIFEMRITNAQGQAESWIIDMKKVWRQSSSWPAQIR